MSASLSPTTASIATSKGVIDSTDKPSLESIPLEATTPTLEKIHYVLCNETGQGETLVNLPNSRPNGVHLGFACWMNFDILAVRDTPYAVLCDEDSNVVALLDLIKDAILESDGTGEFIETFWGKLSTTLGSDFKELIAGDGSPIDKATFARIAQEQGWLSSDDKFHVIKDMYSQGRIVHRQLNILEKDKFRELQTWADEQGLCFDSIYTSNIPEWIYHSAIDSDIMMANISRLIDPHTVTVTAQKESLVAKGARPKQSVTIGSHPKVQYTKTKTRSFSALANAGSSPTSSLFDD